LIFPYLPSDAQLLTELCDIAKYVSSLNLKPVYYDLLLQFAVYGPTSVYDYVYTSGRPLKSRSTRDPRDPSKPRDIRLQKYNATAYRNAKNQTPRLIKLRLIERIPEHPRLSKAKKCKLTKNGVYVVVTPQLTPSLLSNLLMDYNDHPIFRIFLYPLISVDTLSRLTGVSREFIFRHLCSYLHDCCEEVNDANNHLESDKPLFVWEDILTSSHQSESLRNFLEQKFRWTWLHNARIHKSASNVLEMKGTGSNTVLIRLSDDKKKVNVSYKGKKELELPVVDFFGENFEPVLLVQKPTQLDESYIKYFAKVHYNLVQRLIFSIVSDESIDSDALRVLVEDNTFREAIEDAKIKFDERYKRFDSIIKTLQVGQP
jgi:hypothetical protein